MWIYEDNIVEVLFDKEHLLEAIQESLEPEVGLVDSAQTEKH